MLKLVCVICSQVSCDFARFYGASRVYYSVLQCATGTTTFHTARPGDTYSTVIESQSMTKLKVTWLFQTIKLSSWMGGGKGWNTMTKIRRAGITRNFEL